MILYLEFSSGAMAFPCPVDSPYMMAGFCWAIIFLKEATAFSVS